MSTLHADKVLDCSGVLCPMPIVSVSKAIKEIAVGQVLKMLATDPGSEADVAAWSRQTGQKVIDSHREDSKFVYYIQRVK